MIKENTKKLNTLVEGISNLPKDRQDEAYNDGYNKGHTDGLAQRQYEVWTITLVDGSIVEKEVALL